MKAVGLYVIQNHLDIRKAMRSVCCVLPDSPLPVVSGVASDKHISTLQPSMRMLMLCGRDKDLKRPLVSLRQVLPLGSFDSKVIKICLFFFFLSLLYFRIANKS